VPPAPKFERGFGHLYSRHVQQADLGCDFDVLETVTREHRDAEPEIH
jgi:dihydroxy-acid dehydratase